MFTLGCICRQDAVNFFAIMAEGLVGALRQVVKDIFENMMQEEYSLAHTNTFVDSHIPMFDNMYGKRLKAYKQIGYEVCTSPQGEKQKANSIYDLDSYESVYLRDLHEAREEIVISSQTLNTPKVNQLIHLSEDHPGLKITIVTWAPEVYRFGRDEVRIELMRKLKSVGFKVLTVNDNCERFAIIDREIVWYGSMNLLSKADVEDNLMRVLSKDIAIELLEMTFGGAKSLN